MNENNENNTMKTKSVPEGYMQNGLGHLVPVEHVKPVDRLRDELVRKIAQHARMVAAAAAEFRAWAGGEVAAFVELAAQEHGVELGGAKGNVTLASYDGTMKVVRARADEIVFTEAVAAVREQVFKCIEKWSEGANANLAALVHKAFETDKNGHLSVGRILGLRSIAITDDADWERAMAALDDAIRVVGSRQYLRIYQRADADAAYEQIALDGR